MNIERFVRWQTILREHFTFTINLLLTVSIATTGFLLSLLNNTNFIPSGNSQKLFFTTGLIFVLLSVVMGLVVSLNRLNDFRFTLKKINHQLKDINDIAEIKDIVDFSGKFSWIIFYLQVGTLCIGYISLIISFYLIFRIKLI